MKGGQKTQIKIMYKFNQVLLKQKSQYNCRDEKSDGCEGKGQSANQ
jgi:hypothetical protein